MGLRESVIFDWVETLQPSSRKTSFAPLKSIWGYPAYWRGLYRAKAGPQYEGILELPASVFFGPCQPCFKTTLLVKYFLSTAPESLARRLVMYGAYISNM